MAQLHWILDGSAWLFTFLVLPGSITLAVLTLAALRYRSKLITTDQPQAGSLGIVIPAHNEEDGIAQVVKKLLAQIQAEQARCNAGAYAHAKSTVNARTTTSNGNIDIWVIADNCTDKTAQVAEAAGAKVLVRNNAQLRGKGYALHHAFEALAGQQYDWLMVVDADSYFADDFLQHMRLAMRTDAAALQANYEGMPGHTNSARLARLAMTGMNVVRCKGRAAMGASAGILGNGFALRASTLAKVPYEAGSIVEDLEYHLNLIANGLAVRWVERAHIYGELAPTNQSLANQRSRWEGGRVRMVRQRLPKALLTWAKRPNGEQLEVAADLSLLPLTFHLLVTILAMGLGILSGQWMAFWLAAIFFPALALHLWVICLQPGVTAQDKRLLLGLPKYLVFKLLLLPKVLVASGSKTLWVRTERGQPKAGE